MKASTLQKIGIVISIPLMVFAVHENLWAEPLPETEVITEPEPAFEVVIKKKIEQEGEEMNILDDIDLLADVVEAEAGNQSTLGKRLVVDVILNRIDDPRFPNTLREVLLQPHQFSVVESGAIRSVTPTQDTWDAIHLEWGWRISREVLYFQTGGFPEYATPYERVGDHYFGY